MLSVVVLTVTLNLHLVISMAERESHTSTRVLVANVKLGIELIAQQDHVSTFSHRNVAAGDHTAIEPEVEPDMPRDHNCSPEPSNRRAPLRPMLQSEGARMGRVLTVNRAATYQPLSAAGVGQQSWNDI